MLGEAGPARRGRNLGGWPWRRKRAAPSSAGPPSPEWPATRLAWPLTAFAWFHGSDVPADLLARKSTPKALFFDLAAPARSTRPVFAGPRPQSGVALLSLAAKRLGRLMLNYLTRYAHWLDLWLHRHIGRLYEGILSTGLGLAIVASVTSLSHIISTGGAGLQGDVVKTIAVVVFQVALLINQLAQLDEHRAHRRRRRMRAREKGRVAANGADR